VKDAKSEAQKEIEEYRKKKDEEFKAYEKEVLWNYRISPVKSLADQLASNQAATKRQRTMRILRRTRR